MQMILDGLSALGTATIDPLWRPVLAWTALGLPLWTLLRWTDRLHPNAEYRLSQLLLAALPVGLGVVCVIEMLPGASQSALLPARSALVVVGLGLTLGLVACSDSVGPSPSPEASTTAESSSSATGDDGEVYMVAEDPPELSGGMKALQKSIQYPEMAKEAGIEGRVIVQFIVDKDGAVTNPTVARGVHEQLNEAALEAVKQQAFSPGRQDGEPVKVQMSLPVTFRLPNASGGAVNGSGSDATASSPSSRTDASGHLFEKAGIQRVRVLMNEEGRLLIDDEPVEMSSLTDAVRQRITADVARAALIYADGAPGDRVDAAEARLRALDLQMVYIKPAV